MSFSERAALGPIGRSRADLVVPGAAILQAICVDAVHRHAGPGIEGFGVDEVVVAAGDHRHGYPFGPRGECHGAHRR